MEAKLLKMPLGSVAAALALLSSCAGCTDGSPELPLSLLVLVSPNRASRDNQWALSAPCS